MKKHKFIIGKKFGKWTVLREENHPYDKPKERRKTILMCYCRCECGLEKYIHKTNLLTGKSKGCLSCGSSFANRKNRINSKVIDLTGKVFGKLTVIKKAEHKANRHGTYWICKCKCGNIVEIRAKYLLENRRRACVDCQPKFYHFQWIENKIGKTFGLLKIKKLLRFENNVPVFQAKCKCGNIVEVKNKHLNHRRKSCGCLLGKANKGEKNGHAKLTQKEADLIREMKEQNPDLTSEYFSNMFNISPSQINAILANISYKN